MRESVMRIKENEDNEQSKYLVDFKAHILADIEKNNAKTEASLYQLQKENELLQNQIKLITRVFKGNAEQNSHIASQEIQESPSMNSEAFIDNYEDLDKKLFEKIDSLQERDEEIYKLKQKIESNEKKFTEGLCYLENKLKLLSANFSKQLNEESDRSLQNDRIELEESRHAVINYPSKKRFSLFSPYTRENQKQLGKPKLYLF